MGKNKIIKEKKPIVYSLNERREKMMKIKMQLIELNMESILTPENLKGIADFVNLGKEYHDIVEIPLYSRTMHINLVNDKRKQTSINLIFNKIRIPDEDETKNPINKLNIIQEEILQAQCYDPMVVHPN